MAAFFLRIYDWLAGRRMWLGGVLALLCVLLLAGLCGAAALRKKVF